MHRDAHEGGLLNLEINVGRPTGARLVQDYLAGRPEALAFFRGSPDRSRSFAEKADEIDSRFDRAARARAVEAVRTPNEEVRLKLESLIEDGGFFVTTGQQPGLFTGPLYSVYKALTAVKLSAALEPRLGRPIVPLFWVASEDHDWAEVDHTFVLSTENELHRLALDGPARRDSRPIHRIPMEEEITALVQELGSLFPDTDFKDRYLQDLRSAYSPEKSMSEAFRETLEKLLAPFGIAFVDAAEPALKNASRDLLVASLDGSVEEEALLAETANRLHQAGYEVQVSILPKGVNLFLEGPGGRERVYRSESGFKLRHSGETMSRNELVARVERDPLILSPNVLLRPVVESSAFPVVAYVAGPGEMAYYAQLARLFDAHHIRMPVIYPRFGATVVESKTRKVLDKFGLSPEDLARPHHQLAGEIVREGLPDAVRQALGALRGGIAKGLGDLGNEVAKVDPTLKGPVGHVRTVAFDALDDVNKKIVQSLKRENEIALSQLEKAQLHVYPEGRPQERALNAFYYLIRYGERFLNALAEAFSVHFEGEAEGSIDA